MPAARSAPHPAAADAVLAAPRLAALDRTALLDSAAEGAFDRFTRIASRLLGVPVSLVSLVDADRQFFKAQLGLPEPWAAARETPLTHSFCQHVVAARAPLVVDDAREHPLVGDNLAVPDLGVVAYLGVPIEVDGEALGSLCAIDGRPRAWTDADVAVLADLADAVRTEVGLRAALADARAARRTADVMRSASADAFLAVDAEGRCTFACERAARYLGASAAEVAGAPLFDRLPPADRDHAAALLARVRAEGGPVDAEFVAATPGRPAGPGGRRLAARAVPDGDGGAAVALRDVTARHAVEGALARSHALLAATLDATADAILVIDPEGRPTGYNRKLLALWDLPAELATSQDPAPLVAHVAARLADPGAFLARLRDTPVTADVAFDDVLHFADGRVVERHSHPQRLADGTIVGRVFSFRDVTERHRAAEAVAAGEARLRLALEAARMTVWERPLDGQRVVFHPAPGGEVSGEQVSDDAEAALPAATIHAEADAARSFLDAVHPADRERVLAASRQARATRGALDVEFRHRAPDGAWRWRHTTGRVFAATAHAPARMVGVDRDVTERREHEEAIREREARLQLMLRQLPAVLWTTDPALRFTSCVGTALAGLGLAADELVGERVQDLVGAADSADPITAAHGRALGGHSASYEGDWGGVTFAAHVEPLRDGDGRVVGTVGLAVDVTERRRLEAQLAHQAFHDPLTGLANRALFRDRVEHALARVAAAREGRTEHVAVLYLDLDDFKAVNDTLGHGAGDRLLAAVADRLLTATRGYDTVARLGGDEFAVLLEGMATPADADLVVGRVARALAAPVVLDGAFAGRPVRARASLGLAHATGAEDAETLVRNADVALYEAKAAGKARHAVFAPAMHTALVARTAFEADLRSAVDALASGALATGGAVANGAVANGAARDDAPGGFRLVYQPVVDLATGRVRAFEALMRWTHPARGAVPPSIFIPVAEDAGLVATLGRWALGEGCRQLAAWLGAWEVDAAAGVRVNVNVSGRQLGDGRLVDDVAGALAAAGLAPDRLTLEVTETAVMGDAARALESLRALQALGVSIAVDDFGTGYSSLAYLQRLPVDVLKIDKAFVDGVARGGPDAALARTVVALGHACGLRTVAEGVETEAQRAALAALGCDAAQGYLFARPLEAAAAGRLLAAAARARSSRGARP
jgi:diguanylate cyclase (GGDEF)-like protein/PAS domain S-box-containing protein